MICPGALKRKQFSTVAAIMAGAMSVAMTAARADSQKDPNTIDILGFHLGMTPDEVKANAQSSLNQPEIHVNQGSLSMGTFKSDPMVFGVVISEGRDNHQSWPEPNRERVQISFGAEKPYPVLSISRIHRYSLDSAPTLEDVMSSLTEKYGRPDGIDNNTLVLNWTYKSNIPYKANAGNTLICSNAAYGYWNNQLNGQFSETRDDNVYSKCGVWIRVQIKKQDKNPNLVDIFDLRLSNITALRENVSWTLNMLKHGSEDSGAVGVKNAPKFKP